MSIPLLLGPVDTSTPFMFASIQNSQPYILNGAPLNSGIIYYWEPNLSTISASQNLPVFTASGSLNSLLLIDTVNNGGVAFRADGVTLGNATEPVGVNMSQSMYANWWPPDILLSRAIYTITNPSGSTAQVLTSNSGTGTTIPANNLIVLPVFWYFNCMSNGNYDVINQPLDSAVNWVCTVNSGVTGCTGLSITPTGWTNIADCNNGANYTYCPTAQTCGNSNCNGPCSVIYYDCDYNSGNYSCVFDASKYIADTQWWTSPWFIGIVVGSVLLILILIIIIFAVIRHGRKTSSSN